MNSSHSTIARAQPDQLIWVTKGTTLSLMTEMQATPDHRFTLLQPIRHWLDSIAIYNVKTARTFCQLIPARCPFERTIKLFDRTLFSIPPLCKLNPFYEQVVGLRFRSLCYLADECGEDVSRYC